MLWNLKGIRCTCGKWSYEFVVPGSIRADDDPKIVREWFEHIEFEDRFAR